MTQSTLPGVEESHEAHGMFVLDAPDDTPSEPTPPAPSPAPAPTPPAPPAKPNNLTLGHVVPEAVDPLLVTILAWPRTHESLGEYSFMKWLRETIAGLGFTPKIHDKGLGSVSVEVPLPKAKKGDKKVLRSTALFSSHVDTQDGRVMAGDNQRKKLTYDSNFGVIGLDTGSIGGCLGADDGVGVWIMLRMIAAKVPGLYVFHRGEECGGLGAQAMAKNYNKDLELYDMAVAFDRPKDNEIITHQRGGTRCASDTFALALCAQLNAAGFDYKPSQRGVYTDVYEYRYLVSECVNVGVGYEGHHTTRETLDYPHAYALMEACCKLDWASLPVARDPVAEHKAEVERQERFKTSSQYGGHHYPYTGGGSYSRSWDDEEWDSETRQFVKKGKAKSKKADVYPFTEHKSHKAKQAEPALTPLQELQGMSAEDLEILLNDSPEAGARLIIALAVDLAKTIAERDAYRSLLPQHLLC